ncbi:MAG: P-loop NTPase fold protein [Cyanobacteria bacterium P01_F01_bin.143]
MGNLTAQEFYRATNPLRTLNIKEPEDAKKYIDFASVRGGQVIEDLKVDILWAEPGYFTCNLFTGHLGCGKSTELLRLKQELEREQFHVVYFESTDDLDLANVDVSDILLAIARRVSTSLESIPEQDEEFSFKKLLQKAAKLLSLEIELTTEGKIPGVGDFDVSVGSEGANITLSTLIGKINTKVKRNGNLRDRLKDYLEPKTDAILDVLNEGLFQPADQTLKAQGKQGLVVIVDNLDRVDNVAKNNGRFQPEFLFADRGEKLNKLDCHVVYTMPLALRHSDDFPIVRNRFKSIVVLPMVPIKKRDGTTHELGMKLLKQMILTRAYPELKDSPELFAQIPQLFASEEILDELCLHSGGHVRNLLRLLNTWIRKEKKLPLTRKQLQATVVNEKADDLNNITDDEWELLRQVKQQKGLAGDVNYQKLIRTLLVYEYRDDEGSWYEVNPILADLEQLR